MTPALRIDINKAMLQGWVRLAPPSMGRIPMVENKSGNEYYRAWKNLNIESRRIYHRNYMRGLRAKLYAKGLTNEGRPRKNIKQGESK